jgi:AcrR family transcriptional regulator
VGTPTSGSTTDDLRHRNRRQNRAQVSAVALELFAEHGFDHVTVDAIAERAGISRRTFFRYFESKEEAVLPELDAYARFEQLVADRPAHEPALVTLRRTLAIVVAEYDTVDEHTALRQQLEADHRAIRARSLEARTQMERAVADLLRTDLDDRPRTRLVTAAAAAAVVSATRAAGEVWAADGGGGGESLSEVILATYDLAISGFVDELSR